MQSARRGSNREEREVTPDVLPASQYLQEKLQERRSRSSRSKRARQSDFGPQRGRDDDIFLKEAEENRNAASRAFDSSPMGPGSQRDVEGSGGNGRRRTLGVKDMGEHMDRLTKQNFALKLELDHRRAHTAKLQEQIEAMRQQVEWAEQMKDEHAELLRINSQLVDELEKRDKAIEEAMDIICDLEDKVADMEERNSVTRPSTANADSGYAGTDTQEQVPPSSPPEHVKVPKTPHKRQQQPPPAASEAASKLAKVVNGQTPARPRREPLVLSQKKPSTHALRSVFLEATQSLHAVQSFNSLLTRQESKAEEDEAVLDSPRLSALSESSFPSIYSPKDKVSPERYTWETEDGEHTATKRDPPSHLRQDSIKRVSQWMDERDHVDETPSRSNKISSSLPRRVDNDLTLRPKRSGDDGPYQSIANALAVPSPGIARPSVDVQQGVSYIKPYPIRMDKKISNGHPRPTSFAGPMFGEPLLPPTPDSASTHMLRASRSSIADDKSLLDTTPAAVKSFDALEPGIRTAPEQSRSATELNYAYHRYLRHREEYATDAEESAVADDDADAVSESVRDFSLDYNGFPDGGSIIMGTPSRFLKHSKPPVNMFFSGTEDVQTETARPPPKREQSSLETTVSTRKPNIGRAETSPSSLPTVAKIYTGGPRSSDGSVTSPRSYHSGSSSNRTIIEAEERKRALSPDEPRPEARLGSNITSTRSRTSPSPARTLSQKTQALFRRMSNSNGQKDIQSEREKSPLPTLTSTPSSAYVNDVPREARRPGTSYGGDASAQTTSRPPSSTEGRRPSMSTRANTTPTSAGRPSSASVSEQAPTDRKSMFKRRNSVQKSVETPPQNSKVVSQEGNGTRGSITRRRGSIRDAVGSATKRPWS